MERRVSTDSDAEVVTIPKLRTNVKGLDEVLHGGLPAGRSTLISGGPGSGKTMLGLEILYRAALDGQRGIFISFEESADALRRNATSVGWDVAALEEEGKLAILDGRVDPAAIRSGGFDISGMLAIIAGQSRVLGGSCCVVIDAIDGLLRLLDNPRLEREQLEMLHRWLTDSDLTSILTVKASQEERPTTCYDFLDYMVDCVIKLDQRVTGQVSTRRLRVEKYRASGYQRNECPFVITEGGIRLVPIAGVELCDKISDEVFSAGNDRLDEMLGGGLLRTSTALISGASGTGKTSMACTIVRAACDRGERVLYAQFEEAAPTMVARMLSAGIDLRPAMEAGLLRIDGTMPESRGMEEHLIYLIEAVEEHDADMLVIDAITAIARLGSENSTFDFFVRLTYECRSSGVTLLLTNQSRQADRPENVGEMAVSSLLDILISLTYEEEDRTVHRDVLVVKSRGMGHSNRRHRFRITDTGLEIEDPGTSDSSTVKGLP